MFTRSRTRMASSANEPPTARVLRSARARATASVGTSTGPSSSVGTSTEMRASTSVACVNRGSNNTPQRYTRARATASVGTSTGPSSSVGTSTDMRAPTSESVNRGSNNTPQRQHRQRPGESRGFIVAPPTPPEPVVSSTNADQVAQHRFSRTRHLMQTERKLVRACEHVILLNDKIRGLTKRYQSARAEGFKSFRYNIRIRLAAVEGVRNMYYEYARDRAEEIAELRKELYNQNVRIVAGSYESDDEFDEDDDEEEDMEADDE